MGLQLILRWTGRTALGAALLFVLLYAGDLAVYKLRGAPTGHVTVNRFLATPLKGDRTEYDYQGTFDTPCAQALFAQNGLSSCWQLRRHPNQGLGQ